MHGLRYETTVSGRWRFFSRLSSPSRCARPPETALPQKRRVPNRGNGRCRVAVEASLAGLRAAGFVLQAMPLVCALSRAERVAAPESHLGALAATAHTASIPPLGRIRFQRRLQRHPSRAYSERPRSRGDRDVSPSFLPPLVTAPSCSPAGFAHPTSIVRGWLRAPASHTRDRRRDHRPDGRDPRRPDAQDLHRPARTTTATSVHSPEPLRELPSSRRTAPTRAARTRRCRTASRTRASR